MDERTQLTAVDIGIEYMKSSIPRVQRNAIVFLSEIYDEKSREALFDHLSQPGSAEIRSFALQALASSDRDDPRSYRLVRDSPALSGVGQRVTILISTTIVLTVYLMALGVAKVNLLTALPDLALVAFSSIVTGLMLHASARPLGCYSRPSRGVRYEIKALFFQPMIAALLIGALQFLLELYGVEPAGPGRAALVISSVLLIWLGMFGARLGSAVSILIANRRYVNPSYVRILVFLAVGAIMSLATVSLLHVSDHPTAVVRALTLCIGPAVLACLAAQMVDNGLPDDFKTVPARVGLLQRVLSAGSLLVLGIATVTVLWTPLMSTPFMSAATARKMPPFLVAGFPLDTAGLELSLPVEKGERIQLEARMPIRVSLRPADTDSQVRLSVEAEEASRVKAAPLSGVPLGHPSGVLDPKVQRHFYTVCVVADGQSDCSSPFERRDARVMNGIVTRWLLIAFGFGREALTKIPELDSAMVLTLNNVPDVNDIMAAREWNKAYGPGANVNRDNSVTGAWSYTANLGPNGVFPGSIPVRGAEAAGSVGKQGQNDNERERNLQTQDTQSYMIGGTAPDMEWLTALGWVDPTDITRDANKDHLDCDFVSGANSLLRAAYAQDTPGHICDLLTKDTAEESILDAVESAMANTLIQKRFKFSRGDLLLVAKAPGENNGFPLGSQVQMVFSDQNNVVAVQNRSDNPVIAPATDFLFVANQLGDTSLVEALAALRTQSTPLLRFETPRLSESDLDDSISRLSAIERTMLSNVESITNVRLGELVPFTFFRTDEWLVLSTEDGVTGAGDVALSIINSGRTEVIKEVDDPQTVVLRDSDLASGQYFVCVHSFRDDAVQVCSKNPNFDSVEVELTARTIRRIGPGERVRAAREFGKVPAGTTGTFFGVTEGRPPAFVVWDDINPDGCFFPGLNGAPQTDNNRGYCVPLDIIEPL